jgi:uncharacterized protein YbjT (DUF2867 family)
LVALSSGASGGLRFSHFSIDGISVGHASLRSYRRGVWTGWRSGHYHHNDQSDWLDKSLCRSRDSWMNVSKVEQKRLAILGASGMVGGYALRYALENSAVRSVTAIVRKKLGISHPKLNEVLHRDFTDCSALAEVLTGQDAAVFCLGAYTGAVSDAELHTITVNYTSEFARVLRSSSTDAAFSFLSGSGADPTGRSRMAFARYKGEAENALLASGFPRLYIFRPAYIYPVEPRKEPNFSYRLLRAIYPVFRGLFPNQVIRADDLAGAMVDVAMFRTAESRIFENRDIRAMVQLLSPPRTNQ